MLTVRNNMKLTIDATKIVIETDRLVIRAFTESDLVDFNAYASVPGVGEMAGWQHHSSLETSTTILRALIDSKMVFALYHKAMNKVIGSLGFHTSWADEDFRYKHLKTKEIGYVLAKDFWGQELMPEAVRALIDYGFNELGIEAFTCGHFIQNSQSKRVIEKIGFKFVKHSVYYAKQLEKTFDDMRYILIHNSKTLGKIRYAEPKDYSWLEPRDQYISGETISTKIDAKEVLVILIDNCLIGWLRYNLFWDNMPFITMLNIENEYQGKGFGKQLVNFWENEMKEQKHMSVMTSTLSDEDAQHFYRKLGYCDIGGFAMPNETYEIILYKSIL